MAAAVAAPFGGQGASSAAQGNDSAASAAELTAFSRDEVAKNEESKGVVQFRVIWNDGSDQNLMDLINLKNIFSAQLPKMPKEYIIRLVLDRNHRSMCIVKGAKVIGGICFRPFLEQQFAEIVFCAITSTEQVKGYGTRIMNHLKEHVKTEGIEYFLTYADNYAIGYFKKQGFTKQVTLDKNRWVNYIKDYDGGTLMQCRINRKVDYLDIPGMIQRQRMAVYEKIKQISHSHAVYPGITAFREQGVKQIPIWQIQGVVEAGWTEDKLPQVQASAALDPLTDLQAKLGAVLKSVTNLKDAGPFQAPVDGNLVKDYYQVIERPMDLGTMTRKLNNREYRTKEEFVSDFRLIVENCKRYNERDTAYYRCAVSIDEHFRKLMDKLNV